MKPNLPHIPLEQKVAALNPKTGEVRDKLLSFVGISEIDLEAALASARRIVELIAGDVIARGAAPCQVQSSPVPGTNRRPGGCNWRKSFDDQRN